MIRLALRPPAKSVRSGASLTEVLIAILILSIGVSAIFSLFPLSILSSIKATQLTNSKLMKENVEQYVRVSPGGITRDRPFGSTFVQGDTWQPNRQYVTGNIVVPTPKHGSMLPEPFRQYRAIVVDDTFTVVLGPGQSGLTEPSWSLSRENATVGGVATPSVARDRPSGGFLILWEPVDACPIFTQLTGGTVNRSVNSWVVDPLGNVTFSVDGTLNGAAGEFGCRADQHGVSGGSVTTAGWDLGLPRTNAGFDPTTPSSLAAARGLSTHGDAWSEVAKLVVTNPVVGGTTTTVDLLPGAEVTFGGADELRLVIHNLDGTKSATRSFSYSAGPPAQLQFANLPASMTSLGTVSLESFDSRYTWIATVNNSVPGNPQIKFAVLFKRKFSPGEEHVYFSVYGDDPTTGPYVPPSGSDLEIGWNAHVGAGGAIQDDQVFIAWNNSEPRPLIQEGKYILRPNPTGTGVEWYKIVNVDVREGAVSSALITVDRSVNGPTVNDSTGTGVVDRAMFLRGLVEVFDL